MNDFPLYTFDDEGAIRRIDQRAPAEVPRVTVMVEDGDPPAIEVGVPAQTTYRELLSFFRAAIGGSCRDPPLLDLDAQVKDGTWLHLVPP